MVTRQQSEYTISYPSSRWAGWVRDIDILIKQHSELLLRQHLWEEYQEIIRANPEINVGNAFHDLFNCTYAESQVIAIRRIVDRDRKTCSLHNLLWDIKQNAKSVTIDAHLSVWRGGKLPREVTDRLASDLFEKYARGLPHLDPQLVEQDLLNLLQRCRPLRQHCNSTVAHLSRGEAPAPIPTFRDIHDVLELVESILRRYHLLLTAIDYPRMTPVIQYNWKRIFRRPWIVSHQGWIQ